MFAADALGKFYGMGYKLFSTRKTKFISRGKITL